jgi:hypothetical protein
MSLERAATIDECAQKQNTSGNDAARVHSERRTLWREEIRSAKLRGRAGGFASGWLFRNDSGFLPLQITFTTTALFDFIMLLSHS